MRLALLVSLGVVLPYEECKGQHIAVMNKTEVAPLFSSPAIYGSSTAWNRSMGVVSFPFRILELFSETGTQYFIQILEKKENFQKT